MDDEFEVRHIIEGDAEEVVKKIEEASREARIFSLKDELSSIDTTGKYRKKLEKELRKEQLQEELENAQKVAKEAKTLREREDAEALARQKESELRAQQNATKLADNVASKIGSTINSLQAAITQSAQTYSSYVDRIQVRLVGANETYSSIANKLQGVFGASPIFQMKDVMEKVATATEKGINFNVEARATMQVLSTKIAATFDAFDSSLLRLIKIQQEDSTQARLGMESLLTEYLNKNFQDSSYLTSNLSSTVTANLLEAESLYTKEAAAELEYVVQKYLGSLSSVGVSDSLVQKLSEGIGYLASGNVSALSNNSQLEQLLVTAATRGGADYGSMLTNGVTVDNITQLMTGLRSLVEDISDSNNIVALNQYAQVFGMTLSDIQAMLNITSQGIADISSDIVSYDSMVNKVVQESSLSKLLSRTGGASIGENLYQNFLWGTGRIIGDNVATYLGWELANTISGLLEGLETGVDIQPFGVGTHLNLDVGTLMKVATVSGAALTGLGTMMAGIGSIGGVNLNALGSSEKANNTIQKGNLLSFTESGTRQSMASYSGDFSDGALAQTASSVNDSATATYTDETYDEEKQKTEETMKSMQEIGDNVKFIVQLLNESGIVIRGREGYTQPALFDDLISSTDNSTIIGVKPV